MSKSSAPNFQQTFKNIDDVLWKDAGVDSELDYTAQTSWVMFLRYLEHLEKERYAEAQLENTQYTPLLDNAYRWNTWAKPNDGTKEKTGDDLTKFVNEKLFPYLATFKNKTTEINNIQYKIGEIFSELTNKIKSGYRLREIINHADALAFGGSSENHELSQLYETRIKNMGNAGRNGGQYYTPRPLIRAMIRVINPQIGETIYDGAAGSCGFLCEAYEIMLRRLREASGTSTDLETLQSKTFYGKEKKNLAYIIGLMNMILHGIQKPHLIHTNTLAQNLQDIRGKDRHDIILANPPFGGKESKTLQDNFLIKTGETAFLFLQHFIKSLKAGGRAAVVIKNTFLSNTDRASIGLRKHLLETCSLESVLDMPAGTFTGAGVKTVVLFFTKGMRTKSGVWYYQLDPKRSLGKTAPLQDEDMADFIAREKTKTDSPNSANSWCVRVADIPRETYDLSVRNPHTPEEPPLPHPQELLTHIKHLDTEAQSTMEELEGLL